MTDQPTPQRPNIILIMADDMGFADIGCYGSEIRTPNLDSMAAKGMRFSQMYNYARCCPTRACLLTGLYPHQAGVGHMVQDHGVGPAYQGYLRDDAVTIAEVLKQGGYQTLMSGKWHVGGHIDSMRPETWHLGDPGYPTPRQRGFDRFYGTFDGGGSYFRPHSLMRDDTAIGAPTAPNYYYTDAISDNAAQMIHDAATKDDPFFLYVAYTAPHWPLHAYEEDIARYEGRYRDGWDTLRTSRHEELKGLGILDSRWDISPRDADAPAWADAPHQEWEAMRMAVYAAQIDRMDQGIGKILEALRQQGLEENTIVMFLADNGGCAELLKEDGHVQRYSRWVPEGQTMKVGNYPTIEPGPADTFMSYDLPWANASNAPFRLYKHWVHEGGISTPFIVQWPDAVPASTMHHSPVHIIDIMATCLEISGAEYPTEFNGQAIPPYEGESLHAAFTDTAWQRENPIYWEHEGNCAIRRGEWKLVRKYPGDWELYNMTQDRTELHDLRDHNKPEAAELMQLWQAWAQRCEVLDWPLH